MREEGTCCGAAPSACRGCRAPSSAERVAGRAPAAGGNGGVPEREDACSPRRPGRSRPAWPSALVEMQKKPPANYGKARELWKCVVSAVADDDDDGDGDDDAADAEPPYHCHGDGSSWSLGAETASRCCHGGGGDAARTATAFPV